MIGWLLCKLNSHSWSCFREPGYWTCDGNHYCLRCGHRPKSGITANPDDGPNSARYYR